MAKEKPVVQVAFDSKGNLHRRAYGCKDIKDNFEFEDTLKFQQFVKTNGSHYVVMKSHSDKHEYAMFIEDFTNIINKHAIKLGYIRGKWTFRKKCGCQGIKLISSSKFDIFQES